MQACATELWKWIHFSEHWQHVDTSILDDLSPSWFKKKKELKTGDTEYHEFLERLKRQHAIETGVVEKLYDLSKGITETFIQEGFVESFLSHDDTNIPSQQLMGYLKTHFDAIDFVFSQVKNETPLTVHFIKQLHQLITQHQEYALAIDSLGRRVQVPLAKGEFKQHDNNPRRADGIIIKYCPPIHVASEMDKLIDTHSKLWEQAINPLIIAAWVHHAFTQIHPFQDGNDRIARLLASLILIRGELFPLTIKRDEKPRYIDALEQADLDAPQELVSLFAYIQKRNIEEALNFKSKKSQESMKEAAKLLSEKINSLSSKLQAQRQASLEQNRQELFEFIDKLMGSIKNELLSEIPQQKVVIKLERIWPKDPKYFWYTQQIVDYANTHDYFFNRNLPRGWFKISFDVIENNKKYNLVISIHHYSYDDSVMAVGAFLESQANQEEDKTTTPIHLKPFTLSLESDPNRRLKNLEQYVRDIVKVGLTMMTHELM